MTVVPLRRKGAHKHVGTVPHTLPAEERRARGKALRDDVPREAHGSWKAPKHRRDPVDLLDQSNKGRLPQLVPIRFGRMMQSPFTFYRGAAAIMAADLASTPVSGIRVQACGDAHLMNFGGFATPERRVIFDINDLDETLPAPWEWDVKRLAASIVIAGRDIRLSDSEAARAATAAVCSYRERMYDYAGMRALDDLRAYGRMCGWALARAHARSGDAAMIAGYMGSSEAFDDAICEFADEYADQNRLDHRALVKAVREGRVKAIAES
ncbi:MAG TPA: DUF2252 family protein [Xanthobacteraceae bacterium]|nr:DUF2252 family protein [Xanthobacteraceae bacterium]